MLCFLFVSFLIVFLWFSSDHLEIIKRTKEIASGFEDRSPVHRKIWSIFLNKANKSEAAVIREMKKIYANVSRPERIEFVLVLLQKLVCSPKKMIQKITSPLLVLLDDDHLCDPNAVSSDASGNYTALLYLPECNAGDVTSMENQVVLAQQLVEAGARVNKRAGGKERLYPLHRACDSKRITNLDYIQFLLDHGADPNVQNSLGETPLMMSMSMACVAANFVVEYFDENSELGNTGNNTHILQWNLRTKKGGSLMGLVRASVDFVQQLVDNEDNVKNDNEEEHYLTETLQQLVDFECLLEEHDAEFEEWLGPIPDVPQPSQQRNSHNKRKINRENVPPSPTNNTDGTTTSSSLWMTE